MPDAKNGDDGVLEVRLTLRVLARPTSSRFVTLATTWVFASEAILTQMVLYRQFYLSALLIAQTIPLSAATLMLE